MARREELADEQWSLIEPLFDQPPTIRDRGRPRRSEREVMNGVLLDTALWRKVVRLTATVSAVPDLPPPIPALGQGWQAQAGVGNFGRRPANTRRPGLIRMLY
jgi:hypothetical protein